jgi:hypothetical protein
MARPCQHSLACGSASRLVVAPNLGVLFDEHDERFGLDAVVGP